MPRSVSIHIGVDNPHGGHVRLNHSESNAWRMARLAEQAGGYEQMLVLRGAAATKDAVCRALGQAAESLWGGGMLFVSFSGHGIQQHDGAPDLDERCGQDQGWCLHDGVLLDDQLAQCWRRFRRGVRIAVVSDSCYSGGSMREDEKGAQPPPAPARPVVMRDGSAAVYPAGGGMMRGGVEAVAPSRGGTLRGGGSGYRSDPAVAFTAADFAGTCIARPPSQQDGIQASLLLLASAPKDRKAREKLFTDCLLEAWADGTFEGSYCALHELICRGVTREIPEQNPQIVMLGCPDPYFPTLPAFRVPAVLRG